MKYIIVCEKLWYVVCDGTNKSICIQKEHKNCLMSDFFNLNSIGIVLGEDSNNPNLIEYFYNSCNVYYPI